MFTEAYLTHPKLVLCLSIELTVVVCVSYSTA